MLSLCIMMETIHTKDQLMIALKSSETHARTCSVEDYNTKLGLMEQLRPGYLAITASKKMIKNAVRVYEIFLGRIIQEGFSISLNVPAAYRRPASGIIVDGEAFRVRVKENWFMRQLRVIFGPEAEGLSLLVCWSWNYMVSGDPIRRKFYLQAMMPDGLKRPRALFHI